MPGAFADYQDAFVRALAGGAPADSAVRRLAAQPGFAVYRNTVTKGCIDALQANYPAVAALVGEEWFRDAAAVFAREEPPSHPTLLDYGAGFADFLADFAPAAEMPYLADVARLDRLWTEAHVAAAADTLDPAALALLDIHEMPRLTLRPHPAARWRWFDGMPVFTIWSGNRAGAFDGAALDWRGEGVLLSRPAGEVLHVPLGAAGAAMLDACARGDSVHDAVLAALDADASVDVAQLIRQLLDAAAFSALQPCREASR
jgi:hypothetical protein